MGILDLFRSKPEAAPSVAPKRAPRADWQYFDGLMIQGSPPFLAAALKQLAVWR